MRAKSSYHVNCRIIRSFWSRKKILDDGFKTPTSSTTFVNIVKKGISIKQWILTLQSIKQVWKCDNTLVLIKRSSLFKKSLFYDVLSKRLENSVRQGKSIPWSLRKFLQVNESRRCVTFCVSWAFWGRGECVRKEGASTAEVHDKGQSIEKASERKQFKRWQVKRSFCQGDNLFSSTLKFASCCCCCYCCC